jgi:hypothetical protein
MCFEGHNLCWFSLVNHPHLLTFQIAKVLLSSLPIFWCISLFVEQLHFQILKFSTRCISLLTERAVQ